VSERNGQVIGAIQVDESHEVMLISNKGTLVRVPVSEISLVGRNTQGVRLINLVNDELLVGLEPVATLQDAETVAINENIDAESNGTGTQESEGE
jgi:DNA gyrase subunit A